MIQDIAPHRYQNAYIPKSPKETDYLIVTDARQILLRQPGTGESLRLPTVSDLGSLLPASAAGCQPSVSQPPVGKSSVSQPSPNLPSQESLTDRTSPGSSRTGEDSLTYLFSIDKQSFFYLPASPEACPPFSYVNLMVLRELEGDYLAFGAATAAQLAQWHELHHFCGKCGTVTVHSKTERALICPTCGHTYYPRISPVVIVAITDGDRILLTRYRQTGYRRHALVAGFVEIGETLEDAVRREVLEEVGLKIKHITYVESQPWPFSSSLIAGFTAQVDGDPQVRLNKDGGDELASAEWVNRGDLKVEDSSVSLTWDMIRKFKEGLL